MEPTTPAVVSPLSPLSAPAVPNVSAASPLPSPLLSPLSTPFPPLAAAAAAGAFPVPPIPSTPVPKTGDAKSSDVRTPRLIVAVRVRPPNAKELAKDGQNAHLIRAASPTVLAVGANPNDVSPFDGKQRHGGRDRLYGFDHVFGPDATQVDVFAATVRQLLPAVLAGLETSCFAYGCTNSGKTHTVVGSPEAPGLMSLGLVELFAMLAAHTQCHPYEVSLSYLEIYNEKIRDLLSRTSEALELRTDAEGAVAVAGISRERAHSPEEVLALVRRGSRQRVQEGTAANSASSRSHAVLQIFVLMGPDTNALGKPLKRRLGKLSLVDLAGSERAAETQNRGQRMIEGASINKSLLALGNCINALAAASQHDGATKKNKSYVNFRDSQLTRLLANAISGPCKTVMIANVSPALANLDETLNTLKFASRAATIQTKALMATHVVESRYAQGAMAAASNGGGALGGKLLVNSGLAVPPAPFGKSGSNSSLSALPPLPGQAAPLNNAARAEMDWIAKRIAGLPAIAVDTAFPEIEATMTAASALMEGHAPAGANTTVGVGTGAGTAAAAAAGGGHAGAGGAESGRGKGRRQRRLQRQQGGVLVAHDETAAALLEETCASRLALWRQIVAAAAAAPASAVQEATEIVPDSLVPPLLRARIDPTTGLAVGLAGELQTAQLAQLDTQILRLAHDLTALPAIRGARAPAGATTPAATVTTGSLALAIAPGPARVTMLQLECLQVQHEAMTAAQERILRTQQRWLATCAEVIREQQQRLAAAHAAEGGVPETDSALEGAASEKNADPLRARVDAALTAVAALAPPIVAS